MADLSFLAELNLPLSGTAASLRAELAAGPTRRLLTGLKGSSLALLLGRLDRELVDERPWLLLTSQANEAEALAEDLASLGAEGVRYYPELEILPYDRHNADRKLVSARIEILDELADGKVRFLCMSARAWMRRVISPEQLRDLRFELNVGSELDLEDFRLRLAAMGYREVGLVEEPGDFAVKGGIVDIFTPTSDEPFRLELFGDEIESLRNFDPSNQRSTGKQDRLRILPCSQVLLGEDAQRRALRELRKQFPADSILVEELSADFLDGVLFEGIDRYSAWFVQEVPIERYLPDGFRGLLIDEGAFRERWDRITTEVHRRYKRGIDNDEMLPPAEWGYLLEDDLAPLLDRPDMLLVEDEFAAAVASPRAPVLKMNSRSQPSFGSSVKELRSDLEKLTGEGYRLWVFCDNAGQADRLREILTGMGDSLLLPVADLQHGFLLPDERIALYTDHEIFDRYKRIRRRRRMYKGTGPVRDRSTLKPGDYVVHIQHGVACYKGIKKMDVLGEERELLHLSYADDQQLFVPVEQIHMVERYARKEDASPKLNRLGEKAWIRTRKKAEKAVRQMAAELIQLYARREASRGFAFPPDTPWQKELEASFLYQDTPDQATSSEAVKRDMEKPKPMDRLICGDVGFGKTEVAIRAAFKAVQAGKQVGVLVPTTILAQQHLQTFRERLRDYPVRIDMVSRFRKSAEIKQTLSNLAEGRVDIIIGTHRLIGADVKFKDIGLLIVDEEHRFGVAHKEKVKRARAAVDVLTLTATPIPRTLNMSLGGIRDVSLIQTPPRDRLPVNTEILSFDEDAIREAILREVDRGGQVFFVHNRVETIDAMAGFIQQQIPDIRIAVGHGQMNERQLERVMVGFIEGEFDVLVSTMIIESGLDIPRVNTILINRADRFGVAQLHQLRGRVGRSRQRAYAYMMVPRERTITEESRRRLEALVEFDELGSGYKLALRDLEIRGAGNMLGVEQHGHIMAVGFDLYLRLVNEAVRELREGKSYSGEVRIESSLNAYLPDGYIPDAEQKMALYQKMGHIDRLDAAQELRQEIRDRFGPPPPPVQNLFSLLELKVLAQAAGVRTLKLGKRSRIEFQKGATMEKRDIAALVEKFGRNLLFRGQMPLTLELQAGGEDTLLLTRRLLETLEGKLQSDSPLPSGPPGL